MKNIFSKFMSYLLCITLCISLCLPVTAVNENNTLGVSFSVSLDKSTVESADSAQTVVMTLSASSPVTLDGMAFTVTGISPLVFSAVSSGVMEFAANELDYNAGSVNGATGDAENAQNVTNLAEITFTIPANTPAGTYTVGIENLELTKDYGTIWETSASASTTLTITSADSGSGSGSLTPPAAGEYNVGISSEAAAVTRGNQVEITFASYTDFASAQLELTYPDNLLVFDETASSLNDAYVSASNGTLTLADYGESQRGYIFVFDTINAGNGTVTLTSAALSTAADATSEDLTAATIQSGTVSVTVNKPQYTVVLPDIFTGDTAVAEGQSYTFRIAAADGQYYNYTNVSATAGGKPINVTNNGDGSYTIANVTGNLVISGTRSAKQFTLTFATSTGVTLPSTTPVTVTYKQDYQFTMPAQAGFSTGIDSAIYNSAQTNVPYTVSPDGTTVTIAGTAITDNITITINQTQTTSPVTVTGNGSSDAAGYAASATVGQAYTLTVNEDSAYTYAVSATVAGKAVTLTAANGKYTISAADVKAGQIIFTVSKTLKATISVSEYIGNSGLWLITTQGATLQNGRVYSCNGVPMLWSANYNAYCTIISAADLSAAQSAVLDLIAGETAAVDYTTTDVNMSGTVDANDAQLVYNMYMRENTDGVNVEKYLRADVTGDKIVDLDDAAAIVAEIMN